MLFNFQQKVICWKKVFTLKDTLVEAGAEHTQAIHQVPLGETRQI